jgi:hypothetical protein
VARAAIVAVLAALALIVAVPASGGFDQPRPHGSELARWRAVGPTPPLAGVTGLRPLGCARETVARVEAVASLLRSLPLGGVLVALADPGRVCRAREL